MAKSRASRDRTSPRDRRTASRKAGAKKQTGRATHGASGGRGAQSPRTIARRYLEETLDTLPIDDLSSLRFDKVKRSILGTHVLYQQYHEGTPISGAWIRVDINPDGSVYHVLNDLVPRAALEKTARREARRAAKAETARVLDEAALDARAHEAVGAGTIVCREEVYVPHGQVPTRAWKYIVTTTKPRADWKLYLDARTGEVLDKVNILQRARGRGRVFDPNPVVALRDATLTDASAIPESAYVEVTLPDLVGEGVLDGPFVTTHSTPNRVKRRNLDFRFSRLDRAFKEVMVYFHIDRVQRYVRDLGFSNLLNRPIDVNVDGERGDNSYYSPVTKSLTFGTGGVDDAEDAEIILHEYGHAMQDDQVPGFGERGEARAMGEGFGDYLAASFFAASKPETWRTAVGSWDAVAYSTGTPPCLRRLDTAKRYPADLTGEEHDDGEIWSACLWQVREQLGREVTDRLVITHHFLLKRVCTFAEAVAALLLANRQLNAGRHDAAIRAVFERRGVLKKKRTRRRAGDDASPGARRARPRRPVSRRPQAR